MVKNRKMFSRIVCILLICILGGLTFQDLSAQTKQRLIFRGKWSEVHRSISSNIPISAFLNGNILSLQSSTQRSDITICISKDGKVLYEETVPASETDCIIIDLSGFDKGSYSVELKNQWGDCLWGELVLE